MIKGVSDGMTTLSPNLLESFISEINDSKQRVNQISVITKDETIAEYRWNEPRPQNMHSIAKTFVSMGIGFAIEEGYLRLSDTLLELLPEYVTPDNRDVLSRLTIHHLLTLSLGQDKRYLMMGQRELLEEEDWIRFCLNQPFSNEKVDAFLYSNVGPYLAGRLIEKVTHQDLSCFLKPRLFEPLAISDVHWEKDPTGHTFGAGGIVLYPEDFKKVAQLYLNDGRWQGKQILPKNWVRYSYTKHISVDQPDDYSTHYGYGLWINERDQTYRADGAFGQLAVVYPQKEKAIVLTSEQADNRQCLEKISRLIYPYL